MYCIFCKSGLICVGGDGISEVYDHDSKEEFAIKSILTCPKCGIYFSQILNKEYEGYDLVDN